MIVQCAVRQDITVDIPSDGQCVHPSSNTIRWVYLQYHVTISTYTRLRNKFPKSKYKLSKHTQAFHVTQFTLISIYIN